MIKLSINNESITQINKELSLKIAGLEQMKNSKYLDQVAEAVFKVTQTRFLSAVDSYSARNPKKMHHIYEWKQIGNPKARLFVIEKSAIMGGKLTISSKFLQSKTTVPIDPELISPGRSGRYVTKRSIFRNKADVMEKGIPVRYEVQKMMAFAGRNGLRFMRPGDTVNIKNPGGIATKNSFSSFMIDWYERNTQAIMDSSGLYEKISNESATILNQNNKGAVDIQRSIEQIVGSISNSGGIK